jgi:Holliday junction resolvase
MTGGASPRRRGDRHERMTQADLSRHGWLAIRFPGSGSGDSMASDAHVDLIAIRRGHTPLLVSCKISGRVPRAELEALVRVAERYGAISLIASHPSRGVIGYRRAHDLDDWCHDDNAETS